MSVSHSTALPQVPGWTTLPSSLHPSQVPGWMTRTLGRTSRCTTASYARSEGACEAQGRFHVRGRSLPLSKGQRAHGEIVTLFAFVLCDPQENDFEIFIDPDGDNHNYYEVGRGVATPSSLCLGLGLINDEAFHPSLPPRPLFRSRSTLWARCGTSSSQGPIGTADPCCTIGRHSRHQSPLCKTVRRAGGRCAGGWRLFTRPLTGCPPPLTEGERHPPPFPLLLSPEPHHSPAGRCGWTGRSTTGPRPPAGAGD